MDERAADTVMRALAGRQHGLVDRDALRAAGIDRDALARRRRSPDWAPITARVLRLAGAPVTAHQHALAAVLDAGGGAVVSHRSAAALWGLPGFAVMPVQLSRPRAVYRRTTALATVRHPTVLPGHHCTVREGVPVTTLARTISDLSATEHVARVERALQAALRVGLAWPALETASAELDRPGRAGVGSLRLLIEHHRGRSALGSGLECRFLAILRRAGLPEPRRQVDLGDERWAGRVDFLYDDVRLVIEVNGRWCHSTAPDVDRDQLRTAALVAAGFTVLPISEDLVVRQPDQVATLVRQARRRVGNAPSGAAFPTRPQPEREGGYRRAATIL